jgi:hypothetical protein
MSNNKNKLVIYGDVRENGFKMAEFSNHIRSDESRVWVPYEAVEVIYGFRGVYTFIFKINGMITANIKAHVDEVLCIGADDVEARIDELKELMSS